MGSCPFCDIINRTAPARVVFETEHALAFFPLEPATPGHTMVVPKEHHETFRDVPDSLIPALWQAVTDVGRALKHVLQPEGVNVISSAGEAATQTVFHVHVHLVPRWQGDAMGAIWPPKKPTPASTLERIADAIRAYLKTQSEEPRPE